MNNEKVKGIARRVIAILLVLIMLISGGFACFNMVTTTSAEEAKSKASSLLDFYKTGNSLDLSKVNSAEIYAFGVFVSNFFMPFQSNVGGMSSDAFVKKLCSTFFGEAYTADQYADMQRTLKLVEEVQADRRKLYTCKVTGVKTEGDTLNVVLDGENEDMHTYTYRVTRGNKGVLVYVKNVNTTPTYEVYAKDATALSNDTLLSDEAIQKEMGVSKTAILSAVRGTSADITNYVSYRDIDTVQVGTPTSFSALFGNADSFSTYGAYVNEQADIEFTSVTDMAGIYYGYKDDSDKVTKDTLCWASKCGIFDVVIGQLMSVAPAQLADYMAKGNKETSALYVDGFGNITDSENVLIVPACMNPFSYYNLRDNASATDKVLKLPINNAFWMGCLADPQSISQVGTTVSGGNTLSLASTYSSLADLWAYAEKWTASTTAVFGINTLQGNELGIYISPVAFTNFYSAYSSALGVATDDFASTNQIWAFLTGTVPYIDATVQQTGFFTGGLTIPMCYVQDSLALFDSYSTFSESTADRIKLFSMFTTEEGIWWADSETGGNKVSSFCEEYINWAINTLSNSGVKVSSDVQDAVYTMYLADLLVNSKGGESATACNDEAYSDLDVDMFFNAGMSDTLRNRLGTICDYLNKKKVTASTLSADSVTKAVSKTKDLFERYKSKLTSGSDSILNTWTSSFGIKGDALDMLIKRTILVYLTGDPAYLYTSSGGAGTFGTIFGKGISKFKLSLANGTALVGKNGTYDSLVEAVNGSSCTWMTGGKFLEAGGTDGDKNVSTDSYTITDKSVLASYFLNKHNLGSVMYSKGEEAGGIFEEIGNYSLPQRTWDVIVTGATSMVGSPLTILSRLLGIGSDSRARFSAALTAGDSPQSFYGDSYKETTGTGKLDLFTYLKLAGGKTGYSALDYFYATKTEPEAGSAFLSAYSKSTQQIMYGSMYTLYSPKKSLASSIQSVSSVYTSEGKLVNASKAQGKIGSFITSDVNIWGGIYYAYMFEIFNLSIEQADDGTVKGYSAELHVTLPPIKIGISSNSLDYNNVFDAGIEEDDTQAQADKQKDLLNNMSELLSVDDSTYRNQLLLANTNSWIVSVHNSIVGADGSGSFMSVGSTSPNTYSGYSGYVTTATLGEMPFTAWVFKYYEIIYVVLLIIVVLIAVLLCISNKRTFRATLVSIASMAIILLLPCILVNKSIEATNLLAENVYKDRFNFWAIVQHQQYIKSQERVSSNDKIGVLWEQNFTQAKDFSSDSDYGVTLKWMCPKKTSLWNSLTTVEFDKSSDVTLNLTMFNWLFKGYLRQETYVADDLATYLYRPYNDIVSTAKSLWDKKVSKMNINSLTGVTSSLGSVSSSASGSPTADYAASMNQAINTLGTFRNVNKDLYNTPTNYAYAIGVFDKTVTTRAFADADISNTTAYSKVYSNSPSKAGVKVTDDKNGNTLTTYLNYTESPFYYFYNVFKSSINDNNGYKTFSNLLADISSKAVEGSDGQVSAKSFFKYVGASGVTGNDVTQGTIKDFLDLEGLFTYVIPYLQRSNIYVDNWTELNGSSVLTYAGTSGDKLTGEAKTAAEHKQALGQVWNMYSPWVDALYSANYSKGAIRSLGTSIDLQDAVSPSSYLDYRKMVFGRAEMQRSYLEESDLSLVEQKVIEVLEKTYKDLMYLNNYQGFDDEALISAASMIATFNFNTVFSDNSLLGDSVMLYPTGYEIKNFNYDAFLRLILLNTTGESLMSDSNIYAKVVANTSPVTGVLLIVNDAIAVYVLPALKMIVILALFFLGLLICVSCFLNPPEKLWKALASSFVFPLVSFVAVLIGHMSVTSLFVGEGLTDLVGGRVGTVTTNDPTITLIILILINLLCCFCYLYLLRKLWKAFKVHAHTSVLTGIGAVTGAVGMITNGAFGVARGTVGAGATVVGGVAKGAKRIGSYAVRTSRRHSDTATQNNQTRLLEEQNRLMQQHNRETEANTSSSASANSVSSGSRSASATSNSASATSSSASHTSVVKPEMVDRHAVKQEIKDNIKRKHDYGMSASEATNVLESAKSSSANKAKERVTSRRGIVTERDVARSGRGTSAKHRSSSDVAVKLQNKSSEKSGILLS